MPERIVSEALGLIDREGLTAFSTRKLGALLGVEAMALYHHFPSKSHLLDAIADRIFGEIVVPLEPANDPIARLRLAAYRYRAIARLHPNAFELIATRRFNTPHALALLEKLLALYQEAGLSAVRAARHFQMLRFFLNGALLAGPMLDSDLPEHYEATAKSAPYLGSASLDATFHEGLEAILKLIGEEIREAGPSHETKIARN